jgi:predicted RNA methylase
MIPRRKQDKMLTNENTWDKLLQIKTSGRDDSNSDQYHYPYEPTPYSVLERLANSGLIRKKDVLLDYGCGKGRVDFFLSYQTKAKTIGIEYDERIYQAAVKNHQTAVSRTRTEVVMARAERYSVPSEVNRCYFFNPFSVELLRKVMARILESYYEKPREILLFFYYPSEEYISYLMTVDELDVYDEIPCGDLFEAKSKRERILVFSLDAF